MIDRKKNYLYNPFLIAFICFALISCLILSALFLFMLYEQDRESSKLYYQNKAETMLNDFTTQLEDLEDFAQKLTINDKYMYSTVFKEKYNENILLEDFKAYRDFSHLTENMFLYYAGCNHVFRTEGDTVFTEVFFRHLSQEESDILYTVLNAPGDSPEFYHFSDQLYILIPFKADPGLKAPKAVLGCVLTHDTLENRFELVSGRLEGTVALYKGDQLLFSNHALTSGENAKNTVSVNSADHTFLLRYCPENGTLRSLMRLLEIFLLLLVISAIVGLAILFASRVYRPLQDISRKYSPDLSTFEKKKYNNIYEELDGILNAAMQDKLTAAVEIEQKQDLLKQNILKSLLNGIHIQNVDEYLKKLNIILPGPFYYVISVAFQQEIDEEFWNQLQDELKKTVAVRESEYISIVGEYESKQLWIICSIDDSENEEDLTESILEVISSFGYAVLVGVGQVFEGMEKVPASWLASMDNLYRKDEVVGLRDFEYQYKDLQWLQESLSIGNKTVVLKELDQFVQWIRNNNKSLLMQLYLYSEFVGRLAQLSRESGVELSSHTISLVLSSRTIDSFYEAASAAIIEYCDKLKSLAKEKTDNKAYRICEYIQTHFMDYDLSLDSIAGKLNVQSSDIRTAVYNVTGMKYTDYVTSLRMEYAKKLMAEQKLSVADISEAIGYSSVSYFIRIFKENTGITPAKYMKEIGSFKANMGPTFQE